MSDSMMDDCESCPLGPAVERRAFLKDAVARALVAVGALGLAGRAEALPVVFASGMGGRADKSYPLPAGDGVVIDKDESVIIARFENKLYAFALACPHQNTALRWDATEKRFQCPKHRSRYRPDGVFISGRATRSLDRFAVRVEGTQVQVNLDALYREDENRAQWTSAFIDLAQHEK